jgi:hypothetical protein
MEHFHERRVGLVLLVALTLFSVPATATAVLESSVPSPASYNAAANANQLLSPAPIDYGWHGDLLVATEGASLSSGNELISFGTILEQSSDTDEVIRHRNFTKALLIILILGGLIRFFTSPTYLKFITDALDPKAF